MKKRRGIAIFLAALFIFNALPFIKTDMEVMAAPGSENFQVSFKQNLVVSPNSSTPSINTLSQNVPSDAFNLSFAPKMNVDSEYTISYLLNTETKIEFNLKYNSTLDKMQGRFRLFLWRNNAWEQQNFAPKIYFSASEGFVDPAVYMTNAMKTCNIFSEGTADKYYFEFSKNGGLCFEFGVHKVYFLIDSNGNFHYTAGRLTKGFIYNFYLIDNKENKLAASATGYTGINQDRIDFIPIVSDMDGVITNSANFNSNALKNESYVLDYAAGEYPAAASRPANAGMAIRFDEPMVYDYKDMPADGAPMTAADDEPTIITPEAADIEIEMEIWMYHNQGIPKDKIIITIDNMQALKDIGPKDDSAKFTKTVPFTANTPLAKVSVTAPLNAGNINGSSYISFLAGTGGTSSNPHRRGQIILNNLLPGIIFDSIAINSSIHKERTTQGEQKTAAGVTKESAEKNFYGKAFTFLEYSLLYDGMKFTLQFKPYPGFEGVYQIKAGSSTHEPYSDGTGFVSVELDPSPSTYQIRFAPDSMQTGGVAEFNIYSEKVQFDPANASIELGAGQKFKIDNYQLKPKEVHDSTDPFGSSGLLDLDVSWQIGLQSAISSMYSQSSPLILKYSLQKSSTGEKADSENFAHVYFVITKDGSGKYNYTYDIFDTDLDEDDFIDPLFDPNSNAAHLINSGTGTLKEDGTMFKVAVEIKDIPAKKSPADGTAHFYYEKIYFLCAETQSYPKSNMEKKSNFASMSLSDITQGVVPPVRNLKKNDYLEENKGLEEFKISWSLSADQLNNYFLKTPYVPEEATYNFNMFISQDEATMKKVASLSKEDLLTYIDGGAIGGLSAPNAQNIKTYSDSDIGEDSSFSYELTSGNLADLRNNEVLLLTDLRASRTRMAAGGDTSWAMEVTKLDKNQTYYVYINLDISHYRDVTASPLDLLDRQISALSVLLGITTKGEAAPPDGTDKRPAAPVVEIKDVNIDSATVFWKHADIAAAGEELYYEVIKTRTNPIKSKFVDTFTDDFSSLYASIKADMPGTEITAFKVDPDSGGSVELLFGTGTSSSLYDLTVTDKGVQIMDKDLTSNEIYYYYVRTVRVISTGKKMVSIFNYNTFTTRPVSAPINLVIKGKGEAEFDPYHEFVINFDAPLTNLDALGVDYNIELALKVDEAEFSVPVVIDAAALKANNPKAGAQPGFFNFTYKVTGLEPGTMYNVRVRLVNTKTKDTSAWSNTVVTRTDLDQEAYNDKHTGDAWKDRYREMLNILMKDAYWITQDTAGGFSAVYRPTMFADVMNGGTDSRIMLPTGNAETNKLTYFIPAQALVSANGASKGFVSSYKNVEIIISPNSVNTETNDTVIEMVNRIEKKQISDYYLKVSIEYKDYKQTVLNNPALSENIIVSFELVGSNEKISIYDNKVLAEYLKLIEEEITSDDVDKRIMDMVKAETQAEEFVTYINNMSKIFRNKLISYANTEHKKTMGSSVSIKALDVPMILFLKEADVTTDVKGYKWESQWVTQDTFGMGSGKGFYSSTPGSFIFAGFKINIPGIENVPNALTAYTIIGKYGLTDFLGYEGSINLDGIVTRDKVLNCAARMMGAPHGANPVEYLKGRGYNVAGTGMQSAATLQETIYLTMTIYEAKTKTKVETLQVKNFNILNGITGINDKYKPHIRAANDLGIYNAANMIPRSTLTVRQLLDMLTALDKRANL